MIHYWWASPLSRGPGWCPTSPRSRPLCRWSPGSSSSPDSRRPAQERSALLWGTRRGITEQLSSRWCRIFANNESLTGKCWKYFIKNMFFKSCLCLSVSVHCWCHSSRSRCWLWGRDSRCRPAHSRSARHYRPGARPHSRRGANHRLKHEHPQHRFSLVPRGTSKARPVVFKRRKCIHIGAIGWWENNIFFITH